MALLVFLFFTQSFSGSNMVSYYTITIFQVGSFIFPKQLLFFSLIKNCFGCDSRVSFKRQLVLRIFIQMANIPLDENLASVLVAAQYVLGYRYTYSQNWDVTINTTFHYNDDCKWQIASLRQDKSLFFQLIVPFCDKDPTTHSSLCLPCPHDSCQSQCRPGEFFLSLSLLSLSLPCLHFIFLLIRYFFVSSQRLRRSTTPQWLILQQLRQREGSSKARLSIWRSTRWWW